MARWIFRLNKQRTTAGKTRWKQNAHLFGGKTTPASITPRKTSCLFTIDRVNSQMKVITILSRFYSGAY